MRNLYYLLMISCLLLMQAHCFASEGLGSGQTSFSNINDLVVYTRERGAIFFSISSDKEKLELITFHGVKEFKQEQTDLKDVLSLAPGVLQPDYPNLEKFIKNKLASSNQVFLLSKEKELFYISHEDNQYKINSFDGELGSGQRSFSSHKLMGLGYAFMTPTDSQFNFLGNAHNVYAYIDIASFSTNNLFLLFKHKIYSKNNNDLKSFNFYTGMRFPFFKRSVGISYLSLAYGLVHQDAQFGLDKMKTRSDTTGFNFMLGQKIKLTERFYLDFNLVVDYTFDKEKNLFDYGVGSSIDWSF